MNQEQSQNIFHAIVIVSLIVENVIHIKRATKDCVYVKM